LSNGWEVRAVFTNTAGSATSNAATATVIPAVAPVETTRPRRQQCPALRCWPFTGATIFPLVTIGSGLLLSGLVFLAISWTGRRRWLRSQCAPALSPCDIGVVTQDHYVGSGFPH
jgi:hypothetical protein